MIGRGRCEFWTKSTKGWWGELLDEIDQRLRNRPEVVLKNFVRFLVVRCAHFRRNDRENFAKGCDAWMGMASRLENVMKRSIDKFAPQLVREWSDKNDGIKPADVTVGSHKKVWWKGLCGHEWEAIVKNRVNGSGCPYCSGNAVLRGFNDAASAAPWIISEWGDKNKDLKPWDVTSQANRKVWWRGTCGHEWQARVSDRIKKHTGCPYCTNERVEMGINDLTALMPELAGEMVESGCGVDTSRVYTVKSRDMVKWRCKECGYEWFAQINTRVKGGGGCPSCRRELLESAAEKKYRQNRLRIMFMRELPWTAMEFYFKKSSVRICRNDDSLFGIPLDFYLPEKRGRS